MKIIVGAIVGIILISVIVMISLQNNSEKDYEMIFFTLQGDGAVSSFPIENNWIAGDKMTYVSTIESGLLVLAASSATDTVFALMGRQGNP